MSESVTMSQIASLAGVSLMTVSRALSGRGPMKEQTRQRVLEAAEQLGYRANAAAKAIATGRFNTAALLLDAQLSRNHLPPQLLYGIHQALAERQMHLTLAQMDDEQLTDESLAPVMLRQVMADGLLVNYKTGVPAKLVRLVNRFKLPCIWIESKRAYDCIYHDDVEGARQATEHLLKLGHRRIAFADNHLKSDSTAARNKNIHVSLPDRREGYRQVMVENRLKPRLILCDDDLKEHDRVAWARTWLERNDRPTAVVAYVPATALPIMFAAASMGINIPGDLSVVTFSETSGAGSIGLTHLHLPEFEQGKQAVDMLMAKIDHPDRRIRSVALDMPMVEGRTCAALT